MVHFYKKRAIWGQNEVDMGAVDTKRHNSELGGFKSTNFDAEKNVRIIVLTHLFQIEERKNWTKRRRVEKEGEIFSGNISLRKQS